MKLELTIDRESGLESALEDIRQFSRGGFVEITVRRADDGITDKQRRAEHKYFRMLAKHLNDNNFPQQVVLSHRPDKQWDMDSVKAMWRDLAGALFGVKSTEDVPHDKVNEVYERLSHFLATKVGVPDLPEFPSAEKD